MGLMDLFRSTAGAAPATNLSSTELKLEEQIKEWTRSLRRDQRKIEREISHIHTQESKTKKDIEKALKENRPKVAHILAKELVTSRNAVKRMYESIANLNSLSLKINEQFRMVKMMAGVRSSNDIVKSMNKLVKLDIIKESMTQMSQEMMKAGLISEMINESIDGMEENVEEEAEEEVNKVVQEIVSEIANASQVSGLKRLSKKTETETNADEDKEFMNRLKSL